MSLVDVRDTVTPYLKRMVGQMPGILWSSIRGAGFWLRGEIKSDIVRGGPPGSAYKPREDVGQALSGNKSNLLGFIGSYRGRKHKVRGGGWKAIRWKKPSKNILGKLVNAVYVHQKKERLTADIGWISDTSHRTGIKHEYGFDYPVTPKMRRFFFAMGIPLSKGKSRIRIPVRATYGPEYSARQGQIADRVGNHIAEWVAEGRRPK